MKKILLTKKDSVPHIVEKILESKDDKIILVVPNDSQIKESLSDIELINREAEAAGKTISIDSVDEEIIELAEKAGIPLARSPKKRNGNFPIVSDIISTKEKAAEKPEKLKTRTLKISNGKNAEKSDFMEPIEPMEPKISFWDKAENEGEAEDRKKFHSEISKIPPPEKHRRRIRLRFGNRKILAYIAAVLLIVAGGGWAVAYFFGRAEISISFKKIPWEYNGTVTASKTFSGIDAANGRLPAEVFRQNKNATRLFPASGTANVSQKAAAKIMIYNAYSSSKQKLVAATRFAAPDGKIFRLDNPVVVPGAGIKNGKVIPSSIQASVTADRPGEEYNIGPFDKMTIPGFKGSPRYNGFYATMPQIAAGGFVGEKKVATDQDVASAKERTSQALKEVLQNGFLNSRPQGFVILDGASSINVAKLVPAKNTDANGNFSVFAEASFRAIGFKQDNLELMIKNIMLKDNPGMAFSENKIDYKNVKADFASGQLVFSVVASGIIEPEFSGQNLKDKIAGKSIAESKAILAGLPDLAVGKVSLWPFWLGNLPKKVDRIKVSKN